MRLTNAIRYQIAQDVRNDIPTTDYQLQIEKIVKADAFSKLPVSIKSAIEDDKEVINYLETRHIYDALCHVSNIHYKLDGDVLAQVRDLNKLKRTQRERIDAVIVDLEVILQNCATVKAFIKICPELEKYVPTPDEPIKNLPATNTMAGLMSLGWPKDGHNGSK